VIGRVLALVGLAACATDEAEPCVPVAAASETVTARNDFGMLQGTLDVPAGCAGMRVVLVISGSGPQDRDGNLPGDPAKTDIYKQLALGLNAAGIASLRFDDLGVGASRNALPNDPAKLLYDLEIDAARRFATTLRQDTRFGAIVGAGHSQGSLTALLLGAELDAIVSLAGAGRPAGEVIREQLAPMLTAGELAALDAALAKLAAGMLAGPLAPPLDQLFPVELQPYWISWLKYDPQRVIEALDLPIAVVQGRTDLQVGVADAERLAAGNARAELHVIDDMNHVLKQAASRDPASQEPQYSDPRIPLHPALLPIVTTFAKGG
jgi:pimeloyl-ACP methyl ester carboxylesterase